MFICSHQWADWCPPVYNHYCPPKLHFAIFFNRQKCAHTTSGKLLIHARVHSPEKKNNDSMLLFSWDNTLQCFFGGEIPPGDILLSLSGFDYIDSIQRQDNKLKEVMLGFMSRTGIFVVVAVVDTTLCNMVEAKYLVLIHSSKVKRWDSKDGTHFFDPNWIP